MPKKRWFPLQENELNIVYELEIYNLKENTITPIHLFKSHFVRYKKFLIHLISKSKILCYISPQLLE